MQKPLRQAQGEPLLVLFDGHAIVHRAFHAFQNVKPLTVSRTGELVSAVYGFAQMLMKTVSDLKPSHWAIAFDKAGPTFRHEMFVEYKAHRPKTPEDLVGQFGRVRQLVEAFHIPIFEIDGFEADDVLGTLSRQASEQGIDTVIVSGDADTMQLVGPHVRVLYPKPRGTFSDTVLYDENAVFEKYGVRPVQIPDFKALVGDPSDNIPGVRGIGEKTAVKLLQQFGAVDSIYSRIDEVTPSKLQAMLRENETVARQSLELATIVISVPVTLDLDNCRFSHYDRSRVTELFRELEFFSLLSKLPDTAEVVHEAPAKAEAATTNYHIVNTAAGLDHLLTRLSEAGSFAFDLETDRLDAISAQLVGISFSPAPGEAYYIPAGHVGFGQPEQLPMEQVLYRLKPLLSDASVPKFAHNAKFDMTVLTEHGLAVNNVVSDSMVAGYLLSEKSLSLKALAFTRLGIEMTPITDLIGEGRKQIPMSQVAADKAGNYACADADMTFRLTELLGQELKRDGLWQLFAEVEMPLIPVLIHMERSGVCLDTALLRQMSQELGGQLLRLEGEIYGHVGHQFNINSPQQLSTVLFRELRLPAGRRGKGGFSTGAEILDELRGVHPVIEIILEYRQLAKLKSTYIDALPGLINPKTGRVHTSFNQTKTATGRLSSSDPNLQNIPVRGELGQRIRQSFIVPPDCKLLGVDYSQIDLRSLAHLSQDARLLDAFNRDEDIHAATAAQLYGVDVSQITPDMRRVAKTVNFGVIYGMSEYGLEQATELTREEAGRFITAYFEKYPGVKLYLEETRQWARKKGYVQTLLGRRRSIPEVNSANRQIREAAERMAINMPVQGTSADIIKVAMVKLYDEMQRRHSHSKMLLQVHDELLFEVPEEEVPEMSRLAPEIMTTSVRLSVPLRVDLKSGRNWGELK